jgi:hypothetical protein
MKHADFVIGEVFVTGTGRWRCTDIGTRVIVGVKLDAPDESWYAGPPFAVEERVFDEYDQVGCSQGRGGKDATRLSPDASPT